jgi:hypothetical protein
MSDSMMHMLMINAVLYIRKLPGGPPYRAEAVRSLADGARVLYNSTFLQRWMWMDRHLVTCRHRRSVGLRAN